MIKVEDIVKLVDEKVFGDVALVIRLNRGRYVIKFLSDNWVFHNAKGSQLVKL